MTAEALFNAYKMEEGSVVPGPDHFVNFLGVKTRAENLPQCEEIKGKAFMEIPHPHLGDRIFAGAAEYEAVLTAVDSCKGSDSITIVELGAGWGPWVSAAGVTARRMGIPHINLIAVEADGQKFSRLNQHLEDNGLVSSGNDTVRTYNAAIWHSDTTLQFPKELNSLDYGGQATEEASEVDYRGLGYKTTEVKAISLETLIKDVERVDYMHVDIQGAEVEVLKPFQELLSERVKYLFIGTHSRMIEGVLIELLHNWGWQIQVANSCGFVHDRSKDSLVGMTVADGEIVAYNPKFVTSE